MAKSKTRKKTGKNDPAGMLKNAVGQIEKAFGPGSIMKLSDTANYKIQGISTGALSLDLALGGQGMPRGRIVELFGPESSGKTTLALHVIANAQKSDGIAAFIDAEHALDPSWAKRLGVNLEELLVSQPSYGEEALQIAEMLIKSNAVDLIVIDSVAALVPKVELDGEIGATHVGLQARMMSQAMRKLTGAIARSKTCVIFINQIREKIGVMFGSPETTPGGRALKFYSSARVDVRRIATLKDGDLAIGIRIKARIVKNKVAPPFRIAEFDMLSTCGISLEADILDMAVEDRIVQRSGSWFSYGETRLGQGREKARLWLVENPDKLEEIRDKVLVARGFGPEDQAEETDTSETTDTPEDTGQTPEDTGQTPEDSGQTTEDSGQTTEDSGQTTEDSGQTTEDSGQTTEDSGQTTEDSGQTTEDSGQPTEDTSQTAQDAGETPAVIKLPEAEVA